MAYLGTVKREIPPGIGLDGSVPHEAEVSRGLALGELLRNRAHPAAAKVVLGPAQKLAPYDPLLRHRLASVLFALGETEEAEKLVSSMEDVHTEFGPWMAQHARWLASQGEREKSATVYRAALEICPLEPEVACEEKLPPEAPDSTDKGPLCQAARSALQD